MCRVSRPFLGPANGASEGSCDPPPANHQSQRAASQSEAARHRHLTFHSSLSILPYLRFIHRCCRLLPFTSLADNSRLVTRFPLLTPDFESFFLTSASHNLIITTASHPTIHLRNHGDESMHDQTARREVRWNLLSAQNSGTSSDSLLGRTGAKTIHSASLPDPRKPLPAHLI